MSENLAVVYHGVTWHFRYFVWALPDSAPDYATEAEARQALAHAAQEDAR